MSALSTPASSPVKAHNEITLTPRTKIRALLADSDEDSEKENDNVPTKAVANVAITTKNDKDISKSNGRPSAPFDHDSGDDEVVRRAEERDRNSDSHSVDVLNDEQNTYERIKRQLLAKGDGKPNVIQSKNVRETGSSSESDAIVTTKTLKRKRVQPLAARTTPSRSPTPPARSSPGLFISPEKARSPSAASHHDSESDDLPAVSNRLQELVAKKREERLAREQAAEEVNSSQHGSSAVKKKKSTTRRAVELESETDEDRDMAKKLTQSARPTRKASKKALEEMHKETQRMSRNMQLAHEAKTKTKFATDAFLKKFNFRQPATIIEEAPGPSASSSIPGTFDSEKQQTLATRPSSPPITDTQAPKIVTTEASHSSPLPFVPLPEDDDDEDLPDIHSAISEAAERAAISTTQRKAYSSPAPQRMSAKKFGKLVQQPSTIDDDDDDDLVIIKDTRPSALDLLNFAQPAKSRPSGDLHVLRSLGQAKDTRKRGQKVKQGMNAVELQISLQQRAREQAQREREEKIQRLREKGVYVQTAEEKEKEQMQIEDMLERARREADELAKREKETAKREGREDEGAMPDSDDDDDWDGEEEEIIASGSDEEDEDEGSDAEDAAGNGVGEAAKPEAGSALVDAEAEDAGSADEEALSEAEDMEGVEHSAAVLTTRRPRKQIVDSDDEDVEQKQMNTTTMPVAAVTPARPVGVTSSPRSALANAFGFAQPQANVGGLSQMFMGTMAESQTSITGDTQAFDSQQDSLAFLRDIPQPTLPDFGAHFADESQDILVTNSQADRSQEQSTQSQPKLFHFETQTQLPYVESQGSQIPEPTQDVGFQHFPTPVKPAQESFVTIDTVPLSRPVFGEDIPVAEEEDQLPKRKGRLVRREQRAASVEEDQDDALVAESDLEDDEPQSEANVFLVMRKAAEKAAAPAFDKKRSDAKGMVQEQAEESDDEYAGLGGVDEEEDGELDEETRKIIDDETDEKLNERAVAKFHADKERAEDEQRVSKLFKDIANGGLRRKRGAEMELWDSDDEDEAAQRRRAMKQREFAKMRKALLADENLGKIAENPKQQAFLAAIADQDEGDDDIELLDAAEESQPTFSQFEADSQEANSAAPSTARTIDESQPRPPPQMRRTNKAFKPSSLADIRNTLSELIGEDSFVEAEADDEGLYDDEVQVDAPADNEDEEMDLADDSLALGRSELMPPPAPVTTLARKATIDRMAARRAAHTTRAAASVAGNAAFQASIAGTIPSFFRKPSLLRRATTAGSTGSESTSAGRGGLIVGENVKQGGTKKSSVNYYVREKEKMARVEKIEKERKDGREKVGKMRREGLGRGGLGSVVGGQFE